MQETRVEKLDRCANAVRSAMDAYLSACEKDECSDDASAALTALEKAQAEYAAALALNNGKSQD